MESNADKNTSQVEVIEDHSNLPVFNSEEEGLDSGATTFLVKSKEKSARNYDKVTIVYDKLISSKKHLRDHPQGKNSYYNVAYYYFSLNQNVSTSVTVNAALGPFSVSVGSMVSSGGYAVRTSGQSVKTKPTVRGDVYEVKTKTQEFTSGGSLISTKYKTFNRARTVQGWYRNV